MHCDDEDDADTGNLDIIIGEIDVVVSVDEYHSCTRCRAKVSEINDVVAQCNKCGAMMKTIKCPLALTAKVIIDGNNKRVITMFSNIISVITDGVARCHYCNEATGCTQARIQCR